LENNRKNQIIKTAVKRFSKHGLGKTTLDEIARDLRIGKATIYHYFDSKELLFYECIEWESDQFIDEVKNIFNNEGFSVREKFDSYFNLKEVIDQRYKLLYDIFLLLMKDDSFEKEKEIIKSIFEKEESILQAVLIPARNKRSIKFNPELPKLFVITSWGWLFGVKLNQISFGNTTVLSKELLTLTLGNILD
jgi:AcrR family transcriptional regulator